MKIKDIRKLAAIRRETEELFPEARAFMRPGLDEPATISVGL